MTGTQAFAFIILPIVVAVIGVAYGEWFRRVTQQRQLQDAGTGQPAKQGRAKPVM
jgi:hypothetical protein